MGQSITLKSRVLATTNQVSTDLAGKKAILHLKNRNYYTLDAVASPIWECLQEEHTVEEIAQLLAGRYDVEPAQYQQDLLIFLQELSDQDLIKVS